MPRIMAPTVAEHRAARLQTLLDAGRALILETGRPPTLTAVALRAGMARPSVYDYFSSGDDLLAAMVEDITPRWTARIRKAVAVASTPAEQVLAHIRANLELVAEGEHSAIAALAAVAPGHITGERAAAMHQAVLQPLNDALAALGAEPVDVHAAAIDGMVRALSRCIEDGTSVEVAFDAARSLLAPYLFAWVPESRPPALPIPATGPHR